MENEGKKLVIGSLNVVEIDGKLAIVNVNGNEKGVISFQKLFTFSDNANPISAWNSIEKWKDPFFLLWEKMILKEGDYTSHEVPEEKITKSLAIEGEAMRQDLFKAKEAMRNEHTQVIAAATLLLEEFDKHMIAVVL